MFKKYKKLLQRIKSLEEYLSVNYSPADDKDGYNSHIENKWGLNARVDRLEEDKKEKTICK